MMRPAVMAIPEANTRKITSREVKEWSPKWSDEVCSKIAAGLSRIRLASDPEPEPLQSSDAAADEYWDSFQLATDAAKQLTANIPALLRHWEGLRWHPLTRSGYDKIKALEQDLLAARHEIEWPFGEYQRQDHRKKRRPSEWHMPAVLIVSVIRSAFTSCEVRVPGFTPQLGCHRSCARSATPDGLWRRPDPHNYRSPAAAGGLA